MVKCFKCARIVNTKSPGVQCSKCNKWIHATCASITPEQLNALFTTESVDWKCRVCTGTLKKPKRLSCIMPDPEEDDNTDVEALPSEDPREDYQTMMGRMLREVRQVIRDELEKTLQFYSNKIDDYETKVNGYVDNIKTVERKCTDLKNQCKNLILKNEILEQKVNAIEQKQKTNYVEICGIQEQEKEDIKEIVTSLIEKINLPIKEVEKAYRKKMKNRSGNSNTSSDIIIVALREGCRDKWLQAAKEWNTGKQDNDKIYIRESLTPNNSFLLWKAKQELKTTNLFKYVWYKNGSVLARKRDNEKAYPIRCITDIEKLVNNINRNES